MKYLVGFCGYPAMCGDAQRNAGPDERSLVVAFVAVFFSHRVGSLQAGKTVGCIGHIIAVRGREKINGKEKGWGMPTGPVQDAVQGVYGGYPRSKVWEGGSDARSAGPQEGKGRGDGISPPAPDLHPNSPAEGPQVW